MTTINLSRDSHAFPFNLCLENGMGWCLYSDEGPSGPCGQSCDTTCPHAYLAVWPSEDAMREAMESKKAGRNGVRARVMWGVIGEWTAGNFSITINK